MPQPPVFVDTAALLALTNRDDALHNHARRINQELARAARELLTSEWVLTELLGGASGSSLRAAACETVRRLQQSRRTEIVPASREGWARAFDLFSNRHDKEWSLVDCASIQICQERGILEVFTHDHHFVQAGFKVLLR